MKSHILDREIPEKSRFSSVKQTLDALRPKQANKTLHDESRNCRGVHFSCGLLQDPLLNSLRLYGIISHSVGL